jgi:hypothetical protein
VTHIFSDSMLANKHGLILTRFLAVHWAKPSKPPSNSNKKPIDRAAPSVDDDVADDVVEETVEPAAGTLQ